MHMEIFFFFFFLQFDPVFFLLSLSLLFLLLFLCILYAGPFEPHLIGIDRAALRRYKSKPNSSGPKI